jgi:hypothetical protein
MNKELENFLSGYPPEVQGLIRQVREFVLEAYPTALEQVDMPSRIIAYGKDRTYRDMVCAIAPQRKYVNLMFARGTELTDAEKILEGTGKRARHVKIRSDADINRPAVRDLLREAVALMRGESNG